MEEKGPIVPPPALSKFPQQVSQAIQSWEHIIAATHWEINDNTAPNGADFYVGREELGHIHLDGEVHIPAGALLSKALIRLRLAKRFMYASDWIMAPVRSAEDAARATWLFRLNYRRLTGVPADTLLAEAESLAQNFTAKDRPGLNI